MIIIIILGLFGENTALFGQPKTISKVIADSECQILLVSGELLEQLATKK